MIGTSVAMIQGGSKQAADVGVTIGQVKQAIRQVAAAAQSLEEQSSKLLDAIQVFSTAEMESARTPARAVGNSTSVARRDLALTAR